MTGNESNIKGYLPPVGRIQNEMDHKGAWAYMSDLAEEDRRMLDSFTQIADIGISVLNWGDVEYDGQGFNPPRRFDVLRVNQIHSDTMSVTKATFREPVAFEIVCSDTGPYAPCYWCGPASIPTMQPMEPVADEMGNPVQPMDPMTGQPAMVQVDLVAQWGLMPEHLAPPVDPLTGERMADPETGQPMNVQPIDQLQAMQIEQQLEAMGLPSDWICHADKRTVSAIYQQYFDGVWNDPKFGGQMWAFRFGFDTNTMGWNTALYEWRPDIGDVILPVSIKQVYFDRQSPFINKMQHVMVDVVFDVTMAKQQYPWIAREIDQYKQGGGGNPELLDSSTRWGQASNTNFQRDIVPMRIGWFRDQPIPLTEQEALDGGYVSSILGTQPSAPQPAVQDPAAEGSEIQGAVPADDAVNVDSAGGTNPTRGGAVYTLSDGAPLTGPSDPNWPMRTTLRRVMGIAGKIVSDMPEDHWDIPLLHLVCFPVTNTPYGFGVPFKCWQIQRSRTTVVQSIQEHGQYYAHPMVAGPTDAIEELGTDADGMFVRPNATLKINPSYFDNGRKIQDLFMLANPLPLPPSVVEAQQIFGAIQTELSGNQPVLQGQDQSGGNDSGRKVQALQEAAVTQVANGDDTEACLQRLAMLMQHAHVNFATVDQVYKHYRRVPKHVLEAIHMDIAPDLHWEARVSVANGGGMLKIRRREQALLDNQTIDPASGKPILDLKSTREALDYDNEEIEQNLKLQIQESVQRPDENQTQGKESDNGNGKKKQKSGRLSDRNGNGGY